VTQPHHTHASHAGGTETSNMTLRIRRWATAAALIVVAAAATAVASASALPDTPAAADAAPSTLQQLGAPPCDFTADDGTHFDFSKLTTAAGTKVPGPTGQDSYYINVCGAVTGAAACAGAAACTSFLNNMWNPIAMYDAAPAPVFSLITPGNSADGVQLTYQNGKYGSDPVKVIYKFICADANAQTTLAPNHDSQNQWSIKVTSPLACGQKNGGGGKGGLSGGWVFVIIVLVTSTVYVIGGCVFKHQKQGTQGLESCPNIDFWREVPALCKDGVKFTIAKVRGCISGNGARGQTYDTM